jgi:hypothetical protein
LGGDARALIAPWAGTHGAELHDLEHSSVPSRTSPAEEDRSSGVTLDHKAEQEKQRRKKNEPDKRNTQVQETARHGIKPAKKRGGDPHRDRSRRRL